MKAYGRVKGTEDWKEITFNGAEFVADMQEIQALVAMMQMKFPHIEYRIEDEQNSRPEQ